MSFQIGDQVRLVKFIGYPLNSIDIGEIGIVTEVYSATSKWPYNVKFGAEETQFNAEELELTELSNSPLWKALK